MKNPESRIVLILYPPYTSISPLIFFASTGTSTPVIFRSFSLLAIQAVIAARCAPAELPPKNILSGSAFISAAFSISHPIASAMSFNAAGWVCLGASLYLRLSTTYPFAANTAQILLQDRLLPVTHPPPWIYTRTGSLPVTPSGIKTSSIPFSEYLMFLLSVVPSGKFLFSISILPRNSTIFIYILISQAPMESPKYVLFIHIIILHFRLSFFPAVSGQLTEENAQWKDIPTSVQQPVHILLRSIPDWPFPESRLQYSYARAVLHGPKAQVRSVQPYHQ